MPPNAHALTHCQSMCESKHNPQNSVCLCGRLPADPGTHHTRLIWEEIAYYQQDCTGSAAARGAVLSCATHCLQAKSVSPQGREKPVLGLNATAPDKHARLSRPPTPTVTHHAVSEGRKAPCLAPAPPLPEAEAVRLGVPVALARSLMQACLPIQAAVQPQQASPPPSPNTIR